MVSSFKRSDQPPPRRNQRRDPPIRIVTIRDDFGDDISELEEDFVDPRRVIELGSFRERRSISCHATGVSLESIFNSKCSLSFPKKPVRKQESRRHSMASNTTSSSLRSFFESTCSSAISPRKPLRCPTPIGRGADVADDAAHVGHIRM